MKSDRPKLLRHLLLLWLISISILSLTVGTMIPAPAAEGPPTATPTQEPFVATIFFTHTDQLSQLAATLDVWEVDHQQGFLIAQLSAAQLRDLRQAGYRLAVDQAKTAQLHQPMRPLAGQTEGIPGYACYRTVEETYADMAQLAVDYPDLATWLDIGDSWQKITLGSDYDLYALILTNNQIPGPKPKFLLLSAIHARELATAELTARFAEYLVAQYDRDPDITWLLDYFEIHFIPQANPDGRKQAETGLFWRKNVDDDDGCTEASSWGVDLNRNSSFKWNQCESSGCSSAQACEATYRGPGPASEPETQAIEAYIASIFPDQRGPNDSDAALDEAMGTFITLHSYGQQILFPWGWQSGPAPNDRQLETLGRKFGYYTGYETCQAGEPGCIYPTDGTNDDWAYGQLGLAAYTFELGTTFFQQCAYFEDIIIPETFPALLYAFKATRRPYQVPAGPESLQVSVSPTSVVAGQPVTLTALADDSRYESKGWGNEPVQHIAAVRYTINTPSWETGVISYAMTPIDGMFDSPIEAIQGIIDTANWEPDRYQLLVESQDAAGHWGVPGAVFLWIDPGLSLFPLAATQWAQPGQIVSYSLQIKNNTTFSELLTVTVSHNQWPTSVPATVGPIRPGSTLLPLPVIVQVPATVSVGDFDIATLAFTSHIRGAISPQVRLTTKVQGDIFLPLIHK